MLPEVLAYVREHLPPCPVCVGGSVSLGNEHSCSDIDIIAIVPDTTSVMVPLGTTDLEEDNFKLIRVGYRGAVLHLHLATEALLRMLEDRPWRAFKFLHLEELSDPDGIVRRSKARIEPWFDDHPDAVDVWQQWLNEHKERQHSGGERIGPLLARYPNLIPDFWDYLDERFGS